MKTQITLVLVLAFLSGGTSCVKERINHTGSTVNPLTDSSILVSLYAKDKHKPTRATVSTFAGSGNEGYVDGIGTSASFHTPSHIAIDAADNLYVADVQNGFIRKITRKAVVTTFANIGGWIPGEFLWPLGLAVDAAGYVYVVATNSEILKISPTGVITVLAGNGTRGSADGMGSAASFNVPEELALDVAGNVYVADFSNNKIRKISPEGMVTTFAGSGERGSTDGKGAAASFDQPTGITVDAAGNVYVAEVGNKIRKISPAGVVTTLAGSGASGRADGLGAVASFYVPEGLALDAKSNLYVADYGNNRIRKITPEGEVTTIAGSEYGFANGPGALAEFRAPYDVVVDHQGNIFVADAHNQMIRKIVIK
jgi:sugar lactone lactonase YvrE